MQQLTFDPVTNRQDWIGQCEVWTEDGQLLDLTGAAIVLAVRDLQTLQQRLLAQTSDGTIVILAIGVFQFTFPLALMRGLQASKQYEVGAQMLLNGVTQSLGKGYVPVIDGIVP